MVTGKSHTTKLSDSRLTVTRHAKDVVKPRRLTGLMELSPNLELGVNNGDIGTLECALLERMYYCKVGNDFVAPPTVDKALFTARLAEFKKILLQKIRKPTRMSYAQVLDTYTGRRRTIYENALKKLTQLGLSRRDAYSIVFVKMELVNPDKAPRCIQPRDPAYNLSLGRYIKAAEHRIYDGIRRVFGDGPTVMKGMNVEGIGAVARGKWNRFSKPVAVGLDATKFDMHVSAAALAWEHSIYLDMFDHDPELARLLSWQMNNKGSGFCPDGKLKYSVKGKRFSGDMNTGLGNCVLMCAMVWAYAMDKGVSINLMNNGDDCVVMMERRDLKRFNEGLDAWFMDMGFRMVAEAPVYELHKIEFCQMHPIEIGDTCRMVRNMIPSLRKDTLTVHDLTNDKHREKWCTAVGIGGLSLTGGVPVVQDFYQAMQRVGNFRKSNITDDPTFATGLRLMSRGMEELYRKPEPWVRVQVFEAWNISPDEQEALELHYQSFHFDCDERVDWVTNSSTIFEDM